MVNLNKNWVNQNDTTVSDSNQRRKHVVRSDTYKQPGPIGVSSLRLQGPAWATAGGGIYATLFGVYRMLRSMRQLRYF
ncbi:hypothetical protein GB937_008118 [Aspergillus fischeri]|nr:hypothetical protein GB937_008118 [Aspergillus fischeri]